MPQPPAPGGGKKKTGLITRAGAVVAACLLVFGLKQTPRPGAVRRAFLVTLAMAAVAGAADLITGGNYMYLRRKPAHGSLLDLMGPWPVYIAAGAALGLVLFAALGALAGRLTPRAWPGTGPPPGSSAAR